MIKLQETFKSGMAGFGNEQLTYTLIKRNDRIAIYERSNSEGKVKDVEVFVIKVVPKGTVIFGSEPSKEDREMYCSTSEFGRTAFSYHNVGAREAAFRKFEELNQKKEDQSSPPPEKVMVIPDGEWTTNQLAEANNTNYITANLWIKNNLNKSIVFVEERRLPSSKRPSKFYKKIS